MDSIYDIVRNQMPTDDDRSFLDEFRSYLEQGVGDEYAVDLDKVWEMFGFPSKQNAIRAMKNNFKENVDYTVKTPSRPLDRDDNRGGHNRQQILMTATAFKELCLRANTPRASVIRKYYITMGKVLSDQISKQATTVDNTEPIGDRQDTPVNPDFTYKSDDLVIPLNTNKTHVNRFIRKQFKEGIHYIREKSQKSQDNRDPRGGNNKIDTLLTKEAYELCLSTYNLKHKYVSKVGGLEQVKILMSLENQTIGFIENAFKGVFQMQRQKVFGKYKVDLFIQERNVVVECDEFGHTDRDPNYEQVREAFLVSQGNKVVRFNPNDPDFDLSNVLNEINRILFDKS